MTGLADRVLGVVAVTLLAAAHRLVELGDAMLADLEEIEDR